MSFEIKRIAGIFITIEHDMNMRIPNFIHFSFLVPTVFMATIISVSGCGGGGAGAVGSQQPVNSLHWVNEPAPSEAPFRTGEGKELTISFKLSFKSLTTMNVNSIDGNLLLSLPNGDGTLNSCRWDVGCLWDGKQQSSGTYVPNGTYIININATCEKICPNEWATKTVSYTKAILILR